MSFDPYICQLVGVTFEEAKKPEDGQALTFTPKDQYRWEFSVAQGEYQGSAIMGWANDVALTPKAKLRQWLGQLEGDSILPDQCERDPDDYTGRLFRVWVCEKERQTATRIDRFAPYNGADAGSTPTTDADDKENIPF